MLSAFIKGQKIRAVPTNTCAANEGVWTVVSVTRDGQARLKHETGRRGKAVTPRLWQAIDVAPPR